MAEGIELGVSELGFDTEGFEPIPMKKPTGLGQMAAEVVERAGITDPRALNLIVNYISSFHDINYIGRFHKDAKLVNGFTLTIHYNGETVVIPPRSIDYYLYLFMFWREVVPTTAIDEDYVKGFYDVLGVIYEESDIDKAEIAERMRLFGDRLASTVEMNAASSNYIAPPPPVDDQGVTGYPSIRDETPYDNYGYIDEYYDLENEDKDITLSRLTALSRIDRAKTSGLLRAAYELFIVKEGTPKTEEEVVHAEEMLTFFRSVIPLYNKIELKVKIERVRSNIVAGKVLSSIPTELSDLKYLSVIQEKLSEVYAIVSVIRTPTANSGGEVKARVPKSDFNPSYLVNDYDMVDEDYSHGGYASDDSITGAPSTRRHLAPKTYTEADLQKYAEESSMIEKIYETERKAKEMALRSAMRKPISADIDPTLRLPPRKVGLAPTVNNVGEYNPGVSFSGAMTNVSDRRDSMASEIEKIAENIRIQEEEKRLGAMGRANTTSGGRFQKPNLLDGKVSYMATETKNESRSIEPARLYERMKMAREANEGKDTRGRIPGPNRAGAQNKSVY